MFNKKQLYFLIFWSLFLYFLHILSSLKMFFVERQVKLRVRNGDVEVSKRDLGVAHIPGSLWSWAPDGAEVGHGISKRSEKDISDVSYVSNISN